MCACTCECECVCFIHMCAHTEVTEIRTYSPFTFHFWSFLKADSMYPCLVLNSQTFACLHLLRAGIKSMQDHTYLYILYGNATSHCNWRSQLLGSVCLKLPGHRHTSPCPAFPGLVGIQAWVLIFTHLALYPQNHLPSFPPMISH